jgi:uncharacterized protein YndB with AHSA1/START domain
MRISSSPEKVWNALADIGKIYKWNPGVVHSEQTTPGDVGVGARRYCNLGGGNYLDEEVVEFDKPHKLTIQIIDTNLPFRMAYVRFRIETSGNQTTVVVSPKYQLKFGLLGLLLDTVIVKSRYRKGMRDLLHGFKKYVEQADAS